MSSGQVRNGVQVGFVPPFEALTATLAERRALVAAASAQGVDHLGLVDHVSVKDGQGGDGLIHAASILSLDPSLSVYLGLYLLPLRHPVTVARQLATIAELAPGRLTFAVGIGGEDRVVIENCGVDPRTRGQRTDECLFVLRELLRGEPVTYAGEHIEVRGALIRPAPAPEIPIIVGGRSPAAHRRAGAFGDGWLGIWVSADRYAEIAATVDDHAFSIGRGLVDWRHGLTVWVGFGATEGAGRAQVAPAMEEAYGHPFASFERWSPCGTPVDVAAFLRPYIDAGCTTFNLMARAGDLAEVIEGVAEVRRLLTTDDHDVIDLRTDQRSEALSARAT